MANNKGDTITLMSLFLIGCVYMWFDGATLLHVCCGSLGEGVNRFLVIDNHIEKRGTLVFVFVKDLHWRLYQQKINECRIIRRDKQHGGVSLNIIILGVIIIIFFSCTVSSL